MQTNDIYTCSFPKSGITFFSFLFAAARLRSSNIDLAPTFYNIDTLIVDVHKMGKIPTGRVWKDCLGDIYKSHDPYFKAPNVIYILRNPVDTLRSYFHFRKKHGEPESLIEFLRGSAGITSWINHVKSWLIDNRSSSQSIFVTQYEDLIRDPGAELRLLAEQLGIEFSKASIDHAIAASSIERMRALEDSFTARNPVYARFDLEFVRKGDVRESPEFGPEIIDFIEMHTRSIYDYVTAGIKR